MKDNLNCVKNEGGTNFGIKLFGVLSCRNFQFASDFCHVTRLQLHFMDETCGNHCTAVRFEFVKATQRNVKISKILPFILTVPKLKCFGHPNFTKIIFRLNWSIVKNKRIKMLVM